MKESINGFPLALTYVYWQTVNIVITIIGGTKRVISLAAIE